MDELIGNEERHQASLQQAGKHSESLDKKEGEKWGLTSEGRRERIANQNGRVPRTLKVGGDQ